MHKDGIHNHTPLARVSIGKISHRFSRQVYASWFSVRHMHSTAAESRMKEEVEHHKTTGSDIKHIYSPDGHKAYYMLGGWIGVWVLSIIVQYRLMYRKDKPKDKRAKRRQPNDLEFYDDDELLILPPAHGRSRRSAPRRSRYADDDEVFQWSRERLDRRPAYPAERAYDQRWTSSTDPAVDRYGQRGRYSERDDFIEMRDYY
eukprot:m.249177 g.249177  ORF g.249177 m.249177 type:complete len:202 (+) comp19516_c1_seq2:103-708(+)